LQVLPFSFQAYFILCICLAGISSKLTYMAAGAQTKELEELSRSLAGAAADAARDTAARRSANAAAAAVEQRLRADLDREAAAERRLAADIADLEQRVDAVRRDTAREAAEAAARAADLDAAIREREATALQAEGRIADLRERLQAAESLWDGVQKPEVGDCGLPSSGCDFLPLLNICCFGIMLHTDF
jgi:hypothetical protein